MVIVYEDVWKEVYLAGTEWNQFADVDKYDWDFEHLDDALNDGALAKGSVYLFGSTEPQLVKTEESPSGTVVPIPVVIAISSKLPPPSVIGIKSVQRLEEEIIPMQKMKMGWFPYVPSTVDIGRFSKKHQRVFVLKCERRRATLKTMVEDQVKKYEYVLPYIIFPHKMEDDIPDTTVNIMVELEEGGKPLVFDYDYELDDLDEFVPEKMKDEELDPKHEEKLREEIKKQVKARKLEQKTEKLAKQKQVDDLSPEEKESLKEMKIYKFYPQNDEPNVQELKVSFINRYYQHATEVL